MKKFIPLLLLTASLICPSAFLKAQNNIDVKIIVDRIDPQQAVSDVLPLSNGNKLVLLTSGYNFHLIELDANGNSVNTFSYKNTINQSFSGQLSLLNNGNYVVVMNYTEAMMYTSGLQVFEISPSGTLLSEKTLACPAGLYSSIYETLKLKKDAANNTFVNASFFEQNYVFKFDPSFNLEWQFNMRRDSTGDSLGYTKLPGFDIEFDTDSTFLLTCKDMDSLVITKIKSSGSVVFSKKLSDGLYRRGRDMFRMPDGSVYIAGLYYDYYVNMDAGAFLMKYDANMNLIFEKHYSVAGTGFTGNMSFKEMIVSGNQIQLAGTDDLTSSPLYMTTDLNGDNATLRAADNYVLYSNNHQQEPLSLFSVNGQQVFSHFTDTDLSAGQSGSGNSFLHISPSLDPALWCEWNPRTVYMTDFTANTPPLTTGFDPQMTFSYPALSVSSNYSAYQGDVTVSAACESVGFQENNNLSSVSVFPNPSSGNVVVSIPENNARIEVCNLLGDVVYAKSNLVAGQNAMDFTSLANGTYLAKIYSGTNVVIRKISVSK